MKKILGGLSVILLIGITLRSITGQQLKADDNVQQTTEFSVTTVESIGSSEAADLVPAEEISEEQPGEIPVIPENSKDDPIEESVSEDTTSLETSTDSSSEESVESSSSLSEESSTKPSSSSSSSSGTSPTKSSSSTSGSSQSSSNSSSTSSTSSSSTEPTASSTSSSSEPPTSSEEEPEGPDPKYPPILPGPNLSDEESSVVLPNVNSSIYSSSNAFSNTAGLDLDSAYKAGSFADSELKGFELPLLSSFEDKRQAALIYEGIKQLSVDQEESLTNEAFVSGIYERAVQRDISSLTEEEVAEEKLQPGDILYLTKDDHKICAGLYLGDGYLISVKDPSDDETEEAETEENTESEESVESTESTENKEEKTSTKKKTSKKATSKTKTKESSESKKKESKDTEEETNKEANEQTNEENNQETEEAEESEEDIDKTDKLVVQQTTDRDSDGKWHVLRETSNELTSYGQELLKEYPASMKFTASQQTQKFVETIGEDAQRLGQEYDVFASVMIAQAILESGSGTSGLSVAPYYNLFGIKGNYKGNAVNMATQEDGGGGNMYTIQSAFRAYPNYAASLGDYVELIRGGISGSENYYQDVWRSKAKNYLRASEKLTGKYATDTSYHRKLASLISVYHLTEYDRQQVQAETPLNGTGNETGIFIKGKNEIPAEYADLMKYQDYNGVNYNTSGSYPVGQCTWYAFNRVAQLGKSVDDFMGNGGEWGTKGRALGYEVTQKPKVGRLISFAPGVAGSDPRYGHVAFVEAVGPNGILISEGNVYGGTVISYRVITNDLALSNSVSYITPK